MKKKNTKIWVVIIISMQLLVLCSVITNASAFGNGRSTGDFNPNNPTDLMRVRVEHHGTHDWIAEAALDAIKHGSFAQEWKDKDGVIFWNEKRTIIFLVGTEAPDFGRNKDSPGGYTKTTLNGVPTGGYRRTNIHNMWFNIDHTPRTTDSMKKARFFILNLIDDYEKKVMSAFKKEQCDLAAFYIGYIVHLISDLATWTHIINSQNLWDTWEQYDEDKGYRPNTKGGIELVMLSIHPRFEADLQKYTRNRDESKFTYLKQFAVSPNGVENLKDIAVKLAFKTRFDSTATKEDLNKAIIPSSIQEGDHNAAWMFHQAVNWELKAYKPLKDQNSIQGLWYLDQIQENLNDAVRAAAKVIDYFGLKWNTETNRVCCEDNVNQALPQSMNISRGLMIAISLFMMMGIALSFFPLIVAQQVKEVFEEFPLHF
ncbi:hypothetical protein LCGC14_0493090 [marine sediment metagenome]|uniref:Phospholipase C/D domain-containing protein n=1 Tax=marine sediment metagenome TaxID=412755 RepID=A0A0F9UT19_9ZZZZ